MRHSGPRTCASANWCQSTRKKSTKSLSLMLTHLISQATSEPLQASSALQQSQTRYINQSLSAFDKCLNQLRLHQQTQSSRAKVIPVRDSKLTRILSSAMHGQGHMAISVHFSLKEEDLEATRSTLDFAERAAQITVDARPKVWHALLSFTRVMCVDARGCRGVDSVCCTSNRLSAP